MSADLMTMTDDNGDYTPFSDTMAGDDWSAPMGLGGVPMWPR